MATATVSRPRKSRSSKPTAKQREKTVKREVDERLFSADPREVAEFEVDEILKHEEWCRGLGCEMTPEEAAKHFPQKDFECWIIRERGGNFCEMQPAHFRPETLADAEEFCRVYNTKARECENPHYAVVVPKAWM